MSLYSHRTESFRIELLDYQDKTIGELDGVDGGNLRWNANAPLPGGGDIQLADINPDINYSADRIRPWRRVGDQEWPLGVFVMAAPETLHSPTGRFRPISLIDKITVVADDRLTQTLQIPAGANVVDAAVQQIQATGESRILATPSDTELTNDMTWPPGTSRLRVINDLMDVVNYWALSTDRRGQFVVQPYVAPADRPVAWTFEEGEDTGLHLPEWQYELPFWDATNHVTLSSQEDDDGNVYVAYAIDDNPDSPTSTVNMKRTLNPIVEENVEAESQLALQLQANRKLLDNSNTVGVMTVTHAFVPVWFRDGIRFITGDTDTAATVVEMDMELTPGSLVQSKWRQT